MNDLVATYLRHVAANHDLLREVADLSREIIGDEKYEAIEADPAAAVADLGRLMSEMESWGAKIGSDPDSALRLLPACERLVVVQGQLQENGRLFFAEAPAAQSLAQLFRQAYEAHGEAPFKDLAPLLIPQPQSDIDSAAIFMSLKAGPSFGAACTSLRGQLRQLVETVYKRHLQVALAVTRLARWSPERAASASRLYPEYVGSTVSECRQAWEQQTPELCTLLDDVLVLARNSESHAGTEVSHPTETIAFTNARSGARSRDLSTRDLAELIVHVLAVQEVVRLAAATPWPHSA